MLETIIGQAREQLPHLRNRAVVLLHDAAMVPIAWFGAYWFRYNLGTIPTEFLREASQLVSLVVVIHAFVFVAFGVHRGVWRFISIPDLVRLVKSVALGTVVVAAVIFFLTRLEHVPRSVFLLHGMLLILLLGAPRMIYRFMKDRHLSRESERKVLIAGAGRAGEMLVRDLLRGTPREYQPIAFVDDDPTKRGKDIQGVRVLGDSASIPLLCEKWSIELILIAMPSAGAREMQRVVEWCERSGVPFRTLPKLNDIVTGRVSTSQLRKVEIDDLLGREPVLLDWDSIAAGLRGKRVLVTGGGGSIGSELCRQLGRLEPAELVLFEQSEFNLYAVGLDLQREFPDLPFRTILGDVCDPAAVENLYEVYRPQVVFHAAAYKHVPLLQEQGRESVRNNVMGTRCVSEAAHRHGIEAFVLISTDKAVNPTSMMGASKRVAEIYCQALGQLSDTRFITVRFGNVLGSAGSVVPLFRRQIEAGGPVTVTHPEVTRYFMTMAEACQLILQASVIGKGGEIYVLDMGTPIKVAYLAAQMIRLSGREPNKDIAIVFTGLRPGEKLREELFHSEESLTSTGFSKIRLARSRHHDHDVVVACCDRLAAACERFDYEEIHAVVRELVPELHEEHHDELPVGRETLAVAAGG